MRNVRRILLALTLVGIQTILFDCAVSANEKDALPPASQRFAVVVTNEVPDFQRHVSPLLGRLGCNGRSCHGSFQGQGGFQLSLFGYDFDSDHKALLGNSASSGTSRTNQSDPDASLILTKPLQQVEHEGRQRFPENSWSHHLLRRWILSGARSTVSAQPLRKLEVDPSEVVFDANPKQIPLRVIAEWENGDREDVTPLCRFRTNDESVVTVNQDGELTSVDEGDSHVIVFYDNGVVSVPALRPFLRKSNLGNSGAQVSAKSKSVPSTNPIDSLVLQKLQKLNIVPSALCSDSQFLRRVNLDLTGTLPEPSEIESFVNDRSSQKRLAKIDELLERPAYAAWWANKLCDFTGCNPSQQAELGQETSVQWYMWMYARIGENLPYHELVSRIVLAKSRQPSQTYEEYAAEMSSYHQDSADADFADRSSMPHYWTRRSMRQPEQAAEAFAHNFLGIRLQCAQCHKHPFAPWTQADYKNFSRFFESVRYGVSPESRSSYRDLAQRIGIDPRGDEGTEISRDVFKQAQRGRAVPWRELYMATQSSDRTIDLLRSGPVTIRGDQDPREPIMRWMADPHNPWFATAFVNRVWAGYFHQGIIDPPDDLNPANPPVNPALLDWLVQGFIESEFDMKWLHRTIVSSDTYQRSWVPNETNGEDRRNFSRAIPRRMPAEVIYDSVKQSLAANDQSVEVRTDLSRRAIGHLSMRLAGTYAMQVFGKPDRTVNCDCERVNQPSLLQTIFLQNDPMIDDRFAESGWLKAIEQGAAAGKLANTKSLVQEAWLRTLSRMPSDQESARAVQHVDAADSIPDGLRDLLWVLLNTKEYLLIH